MEFGINVVLGLATGLPMAFQCGMSWSFCSRHLAEIFGNSATQGQHIMLAVILAAMAAMSAMWLLLKPFEQIIARGDVAPRPGHGGDTGSTRHR